jgi:hypothetical protein
MLSLPWTRFLRPKYLNLFLGNRNGFCNHILLL